MAVARSTTSLNGVADFCALAGGVSMSKRRVGTTPHDLSAWAKSLKRDAHAVALIMRFYAHYASSHLTSLKFCHSSVMAGLVPAIHVFG
jgi:hypothetical protein